MSKPLRPRRPKPNAQAERTRVTWLDYSTFVNRLVGAVSVGLLFVKEQRTIEDYFLASHSMGFPLVGVSVLAALFSGISYLGCPNEIYAHEFTFVVFGLSFVIATAVTTRLFMPHSYHSRFHTARHYLEERFPLSVRLLASSSSIYCASCFGRRWLPRLPP